MNLHESLHTQLASDADVVALIATRVYPLLIPQQAYNDATRHGCAVFSRTGVVRQVLYCGTDRLTQSALQIDCYARTHAETLAIAKAVRLAITDFRGELGGSGGIVVKHIACDNELEFTDPEPGLYRVSLFFTVWHLDD